MKRQDPPAIVHSSHNPRTAEIDAEIEKLKANPGVWYLVIENTTGLNTATYRKRGCETTSRRLGKDKRGFMRWDVYARWPR